MNDVNKKRKAMLLMALCAVMWSIGGIFMKLISWNPLLIAGARSLIAAVVLGIYMIYARISVRSCRYSWGAGIGLSMSCICFVVANKLTTAANAVVLQYTAPVFILLMTALIFRQRLKRREILVVTCSMAGIILFFFDQLSPGNILGNFTGVLSGVFLALMFVMVGRGGEDDSIRMSGILFAHCMTAAAGLPAALIAPPSCNGTEIICIIILGVFQLGIPYVLYATASKNCPPLACSLIGMLEPLLNPVWVAIFIGEMPGTFALAGAAVIIAAVTWWCISESRRNADDAPPV